MDTVKNRTPIAAKSLRNPIIHPGEILREFVLEDRGITQLAFAKSTGLPVSRINDILKGRRGVTVDAAIRFARVLGMSDEFWINLQSNYERSRAIAEKGTEYARLKPLAA